MVAGLDQTRGWFYSLTVLSTILFDKPAFKNLVCNGMVLAEDGKKMSKSLKNYPVSRPYLHACCLFQCMSRCNVCSLCRKLMSHLLFLNTTDATRCNEL